MTPTLRPYQREVVDALRQRYREGHTAPLYCLPTGGGKTVVFSAISQGAAARGNRVMILVHRQELLQQASANLTSIGVPHGLVAPGHTPTAHHVQVASVQTLVRRLHRVRPPDLIVIDEAHHATAGSWGKVIAQFPDARLLGVTATPCRTDGQGLGRDGGGVFDTMVLGPSIRELIAGGYLVPPIVYAPSTVDLRGVHTVAGDYNKKEAAAAVDKPAIIGNAVEHYRRHCDGQPAIAFCASVEHAEHVAAQFRAQGYRAASVDGKMPDPQRRQMIADLGGGRLNVLTSCDLIGEGVDVPVVAAAILLRPTQSTGLYLQQVGRALRPAPGKIRAVILDHVGNALRHGLPDDDREWTLDGGDVSGRASRAGDAPPVRQCPRCYACHTPAPVCPQCGHQYEPKPRQIDEREGELQELTADQAKAAKRRQMDERAREISKARDREALEKIAAARGYKRGWIDYILAAREKRGTRGSINPFGTVKQWKGEI